jgi:hypothetical protein
MISGTNAVRLKSNLLEKISKHCSTRQGSNHPGTAILGLHPLLSFLRPEHGSMVLTETLKILKTVLATNSAGIFLGKCD